MTTIRKIALFVFSGLIIIFISSLVLIRANLLEVLENSNEQQYQAVREFQDYDQLVISSHWKVSLRQGDEFGIAVGKAIPRSAYQVIRLDKTVELKADSAVTDLIPIKIIVPKLKSIKMYGNSELRIAEFSSDSLEIHLNDSTQLQAFDNLMKKVTIYTNGKSSIKFRDSEWD